MMRKYLLFALWLASFALEGRVIYGLDNAPDQSPVADTPGVKVEKPSGFRGFPWGTPIDKVRAEEGNPIATETTTLAYNSEIAGVKLIAMFAFADGKLKCGAYQSSGRHMEPNDYIDDFNKIVDLLTEKYGAPIYNKPIWKNEAFKADKKNWGIAVASEQVKFGAQWLGDDTRIHLLLSGEKFTCTLGILYDDPREDAEQQKEEKARKAADRSKL